MINSILILIMSLCGPASAAFGTRVFEEVPNCPELKWKIICTAGAIFAPILCSVLVAYVVVIAC